MTRLLSFLAGLAGLAAVAFIGAGYLPDHLLAFSLVATIGVFFIVGAVELARYRQATDGLAQAVAALSEPPADLSPWLERLPAALRPAVRRRIDGEAAALPGPALTPYLAGLLVLLGMLGTFLGMVVTLRGTGQALAQATDVEAIRASLAAPVLGLGLAFGCSVAGVAASAMLGLMSALVRRERQEVVRALDARIPTALRAYTPAYRRDESLKLLQVQAGQVPALVAQLEALGQQLARQNEALGSQLAKQNEALAAQLVRQSEVFGAEFARHNEALGTQLARQSEAVGSQLARQNESVGPQLAQQVEALASQLVQRHEALGAQLGRQHEALAARLATRDETLGAALSRQSEAVGAQLVEQSASAATEFARRSEALSARLLSGQDRFHEAAQRAYTELAASVDRSLQTSMAESGRLAGAVIEPAVQATLGGLVREAAALQATLAGAVDRQLDGMAARLEASTRQLADGLLATTGQLSEGLQAGARQFTERLEEGTQRIAERLEASTQQVAEGLERSTRHLADGLQATLAEQGHRQASAAEAWQGGLARAGERYAQQTQAVVDRLGVAQAAWEAAATKHEQARTEALRDGLAAMTTMLRDEGRTAVAALVERQQQAHTALEETALRVTADGQARTRTMLAEIDRLVQAASEAPRVAADVIGELRTALSDSLVRDNVVLEERNRLLATMQELLDAVRHAGSEQRVAIDQLVQSASEMLERTGGRFAEAVDAEARALQGAAVQVGAGAAEVASLGEGFGAAVTRFGESSEQLSAQLQRIEAALGRTLARSDEQLAYYVAQAREIVDLTLGSHKQVVDELQQIARPAPPKPVATPTPAPTSDAAPSTDEVAAT